MSASAGLLPAHRHDDRAEARRRLEQAACDALHTRARGRRLRWDFPDHRASTLEGALLAGAPLNFRRAGRLTRLARGAQEESYRIDVFGWVQSSGLF
jgi:hypothetical protein